MREIQETLRVYKKKGCIGQKGQKTIDQVVDEMHGGSYL